MLLDPATGNNFFGRSDILELLKKRVDGLRCGYRQNVAIIGPQYYGKTSIIYRFMNGISFKDIVPIYVEVKDKEFPVFAEKFISTFLFKYLTALGYSVQDINELYSVCSERMPKTAKAAKAIIGTFIKSGKEEKAYSALFELSSIACEETSLRPIIILDEFHRIGDFKIATAFAALGKNIMLQEDTMYLVASSQINQARQILSEKLSLLFGNFEIYELRTFESKTAVDFIGSRFRENPIMCHFRDFLVAFTGGHPFYLDSILVNLKANLTAPTEGLQEDKIVQSFVEILFDSKGILNQHFVNIISELERRDRRYPAALLAVANGGRSTSSICEISRIKEIKPLLSYLINLGWIVKCGSIYLIRDKVFEFWLKNVYQNKESLLDAAYESKITKFKTRTIEKINRYYEISGRDIIQRLSALFTSFNGELLEIDNRAFRFPVFKKTDVYRTKTDNISYLLLSGKGCLWAVLTALSPLRNDDITAFLAYCRPMNAAIKRRIIISPFEMDTNVRLIAKEERFWIWGIKELNELFDISDAERMILPETESLAPLQIKFEDTEGVKTA